MARARARREYDRVQDTTRTHVKLPIGRTARLVFELDAIRGECAKAAADLLDQPDMDGNEFEECAKLDDAIGQAHRLLKAHLRRIMLARIKRHTEADDAD
jgi:hypothetical protein